MVRPKGGVEIQDRAAGHKASSTTGHKLRQAGKPSSLKTALTTDRPAVGIGE
jgi:hypothetical protein